MPDQIELIPDPVAPQPRNYTATLTPNQVAALRALFSVPESESGILTSFRGNLNGSEINFVATFIDQ